MGRFLSFPSVPLLAATSVRDVVVVEDACRAIDTAGSHVAAWKRMHEVGVERVLARSRWLENERLKCAINRGVRCSTRHNNSVQCGRYESDGNGWRTSSEALRF